MGYIELLGYSEDIPLKYYNSVVTILMAKFLSLGYRFDGNSIASLQTDGG